MKEMQFVIEIQAPKQKIWDVMWQDATFREWAGLIDPGTHIVGELTEGNEIQFISGNGYGVTSLVEKLIAGEFMQFRHSADTQNSGTEERAKEWTGGKETYTLTEANGVTSLTAVFDVPQELEEYFATAYPKAFAKVKELAENV